MTIQIRCTCGQVYHADPAHAGRSIGCRCGRTVPVPAGSPAPEARSGARTAAAPKVRIQKRRSSSEGVPRTPLQRALPLLAWGWLALAVTIAGVMWLLGDVWWPASVLLFGPRWLLLVPAVPLVLAALVARRRLLLPVILGVLVTLGPVMGIRTGWRRWLGSAPRGDLRIITFNVASAQNSQLTGVPDALGKYHPDVVVFEECQERLAAPELWPPGWTALSKDGGICLATHLPLIASEVLTRVNTGSQGGTGNVTLFRLRSGNDTIAVAGVHLETPRKGLASLRSAGNADRMPVNILVRDAGARRISRWIFETARDPIIAGDFNMPVESRIYREYFIRCANAFSQVGTGFGWTRVLRRFSARIDHVLTCGGWRPVHVEVGPALGSDHRPVIVDLARTR